MLDWQKIVHEQSELADKLLGAIPHLAPCAAAARDDIELLWLEVEWQRGTTEDIVERLSSLSGPEDLIRHAERAEAKFRELQVFLGKMLLRIGFSLGPDKGGADSSMWRFGFSSLESHHRAH